NSSGSDFITVTGTGTAADPYKVSIKEGAANSMLVTNAAGQLEWATIESILAAKDLTAADGAAATIEVASGGVGATLVETSLRVKAESITTSQIKDGTIAPVDIADAGANQVLVTGADNKPTWINQSALGNTVTANNGLTKVVNNVKLGGKLEEATKLETDVTNTLAITGLQKGDLKTDKYVVMDAAGVLKQLKAAMPKYFYAPSVPIPTHDANANVLTGVQTIELHTIYKQQFGYTAGTSQVRSNNSATLPTLDAGELDYFVTYFDEAVFTAVSIDATGQLKYAVKPGAIVTNKTFMNIVFAVKD
ncbi:hypothetical protein, partial [Sphingobacterium pedocola]|nr:hypothetical protein [Sphingobacterium pedocola]